MKRNVFLILILCSLLIVTGCNNPFSKEDNYSSYEIHHYDTDFNHTEEIVAKYDSEGKLKKLEMYMVYDQIKEQSDCDEWEQRHSDIVDLTYPEVEISCTITNKGTKIYYVMTDKSLEAGYLTNNDDYYSLDFTEMYIPFKDESSAKETIQKNIDNYKQQGIEYNDQNYVVIDGKKTGW